MFIVENKNIWLFIGIMLVGIILSVYSALKHADDKKKVANICASIPFSVLLFSHISYVLVNIDGYYGTIFNVFSGGYMVYGGILGFIICVLIFSGKQYAKYLDIFSAPMLIMLAAFRVAEGALGQGYGEYYDSSIFARFPFMVYDASYNEWAIAIFMIEALVALIILLIVSRQKYNFDGDKFMLSIGMYSAMQIVLESLRRDGFLRIGFVRIEELIAAIVVSLVLILYSKYSHNIYRLIKLALYIVFAVLLEFAMEGRVSFLLFLDEFSCYLLLFCISVLLCLELLSARKRRKYENI